jgi:hypothetical protein
VKYLEILTAPREEERRPGYLRMGCTKLSIIYRDSHAPAGMKEWTWLRMGCTIRVSWKGQRRFGILEWTVKRIHSEAGFSFTRIQTQESHNMEKSEIP